MIFSRNLIRALGLVCILMGSEPSALGGVPHKVGSSFHSSGKGYPDVWCVFYCRLPKAKIRNIHGYVELTNVTLNCPGELKTCWEIFYKWLDSLETAYPLLVEYTLEGIAKEVLKNSASTPSVALAISLNNAFHEIANTQNEMKEILEPLGTMISLWNSLFGHDYLVPSRYANLTMSRIPHESPSQGKLVEVGMSRIPWKSRCRLPSPTKDEFMYQVLTSDFHNEKTFYEPINPARTFHSTRFRAFGDFVNSAVIRASQKCGLYGIRLDKFLFELSHEFRHKPFVRRKGLRLELANTKSLPTIPFLSPLNSIFKDLVSKIPEFNLGKLSETFESGKIDGNVYLSSGDLFLVSKVTKKDLTTGKIFTICWKEFQKSPGPQILLVVCGKFNFSPNQIHSNVLRLERRIAKESNSDRNAQLGARLKFCSELEDKFLLLRRKTNGRLIVQEPSGGKCKPSYKAGQKILILATLRDFEFLKR